MNKKIIIMLCICMLFAMSGAVQAATEPPAELMVMDSQELQTQTTAIDPALQPNVIYQTHIQNIGMQEVAFNGVVSGTTGKGLRLEGIKIFIEDYSYDLGVEYQTHIQNIGWEKEAGQGLKSNFQFSGSEGKSYRLEGIKINLTGADADKFDIVYRTQIQDIGWEQKWKKNGEISGTEGQGKRLEAIVIKVVPAGTQVPAGTPVTFSTYKNPNYGCNMYPCIYINYVPWKINFDNSNCQHEWEGEFWRYVVYKGDLLKYIAQDYSHETGKWEELTLLYEADVANGCTYNYVEWLQGHGNTKYPGGIKGGPLATMYNLTKDRYAVAEEMREFGFEFLPAFYYCKKCGQTSLGDWNKYKPYKSEYYD